MDTEEGNSATILSTYLNLISYKMRPKPIFTVGLPSTLGPDALHHISKEMTQNYSDYHVLVHTQVTSNDVIFQAFYPKDFDEVAFQELKAQVLNLVHQ